MNMDTNKINDLAKILRQNQLTKLDLTEGDTRIVLEAGGRQAVVEMPVVSVENIAEVPVAEMPSVEKAEAPAGVAEIPVGGYGLSCTTGRGRALCAGGR